MVDWRLRAIRQHLLARRHWKKVMVYDERDCPWRSFPGVYVSAPAQAFDGASQRAWGYITTPDVPRHRLIPTFSSRSSSPTRRRVVRRCSVSVIRTARGGGAGVHVLGREFTRLRRQASHPGGPNAIPLLFAPADEGRRHPALLDRRCGTGSRHCFGRLGSAPRCRLKSVQPPRPEAPRGSSDFEERDRDWSS